MVVAVAAVVAVVLVVIVVAVKLGKAIVEVAMAAVEVEAAAAAVVAAAAAAGVVVVVLLLLLLLVVVVVVVAAVAVGDVCGGTRGGCGAGGVGGGRGGLGMPRWRLRCQVQSQRWGKGCQRMYLQQGLKKVGLDSEHRTLSDNTVLGLRSRAQNFGFNTWVFAAERTVELHQLLRPARSSLTDALKGLKAACNKHQSAQHLEHPPP